MPFVFSPSSVMTYMTCPRKFWGQSIAKIIKWKPSKQKSRGTLLHEQIQDALRHPEKFDKVQQDTQLDAQYVYDRVSDVQEFRNMGHKLYIEHEMCMNKAGVQVGWWDDKAFLRAKADVVLLHDDPNQLVRVIDIKTGRNWDNNAVQLRLEALLAHIIYHRPLVRYEYWYIDQGETEEGVIDFRHGLAPVQDLYDTMREMGTAIKNNNFPCQRNNLCRWCEFHQTKDCDLYGNSRT